MTRASACVTSTRHLMLDRALEAMFKKLAHQVDRVGEYGFAPILRLKEYLAERNDFVSAAMPTGNQATVITAAANEFDNAEVDEPTGRTTTPTPSMSRRGIHCRR